MGGTPEEDYVLPCILIRFRHNHLDLSSNDSPPTHPTLPLNTGRQAGSPPSGARLLIVLGSCCVRAHTCSREGRCYCWSFLPLLLGYGYCCCCCCCSSSPSLSGAPRPSPPPLCSWRGPLLPAASSPSSAVAASGHESSGWCVDRSNRFINLSYLTTTPPPPHSTPPVNRHQRRRQPGHHPRTRQGRRAIRRQGQRGRGGLSAARGGEQDQAGRGLAGVLRRGPAALRGELRERGAGEGPGAPQGHQVALHRAPAVEQGNDDDDERTNVHVLVGDIYALPDHHLIDSKPKPHQQTQAKPLVSQVPNLWMVETVDSTKLADRLQSAAAAAMEQRGNEPLRVLIQVYKR